VGEVPLERDGVPASGPRGADLREGAEASEIRRDCVDDDHARVVIGADGANGISRRALDTAFERRDRRRAGGAVSGTRVGRGRHERSRVGEDAELEAADDGLDHLLDAHR
jgi:flavin-dependent dehydrogenase